MAKENKSEYAVEKEVWAKTKTGDEVLVGFLRSKDERVYYFNPLPRVGLKWLDSLKDHQQTSEEDEIEF